VKYRPLGRTGWKVSEISFRAWAIGGSWGQVSEQDAMAALHKAIECGVNFFDTADVYGHGRSEQLIAKLTASHTKEIIVATKAGRRLPKQTVAGYSATNLTAWVNDSLRNLRRMRSICCNSIALLANSMSGRKSSSKRPNDLQQLPPAAR
jgi:aryl-alcohol dehydrogenase-like predicted oxidoreductase